MPTSQVSSKSEVIVESGATSSPPPKSTGKKLATLAKLVRENEMREIYGSPIHENHVGFIHVPESTKVVEKHTQDDSIPDPETTVDGIWSGTEDLELELEQEPLPTLCPNAEAVVFCKDFSGGVCLCDELCDRMKNIKEGSVFIKGEVDPTLGGRLLTGSRADTIIIDDSELEDTDDHADGLPDSGKRRGFTTGSVRDIRDGKGRFDLVSPIAILSIAKRLEDGQDKYGERNWEKGQPLMSYLDSALRHIFGYLTDTMLGNKSTEDHMSAALWNLHSFVHTQEMIKEGWLPDELDDLPTPEKVGLKRSPEPKMEWEQPKRMASDCGCKNKEKVYKEKLTNQDHDDQNIGNEEGC